MFDVLHELLSDGSIIKTVGPLVPLLSEDLQSVGQGGVGVEISLLPDISSPGVDKDRPHAGVTEVWTFLTEHLGQGCRDWDALSTQVNSWLDNSLPGYFLAPIFPPGRPVARHLSRHSHRQRTLQSHQQQ